MNVKKLFVLLVVGMSLIFPNLSYAWNDTTHMLIAMIAERHLNPGTMDKIDELAEDTNSGLSVPFYFANEACWAGDISRYGLKALDAWREMPIPYDPHGILTEAMLLNISDKLKTNSLCFALNEARNTLKNPDSGAWEKIFMLRILIHCVANIHHPLHCANLYSFDFPAGDMGGRLFVVGDQRINLRTLWDDAVNDVISVPGRFHYGTYEERNELIAMLERILWECPYANFTVCKTWDFENWAQESHRLAIEYAYKNIQPGETPSSDYLRMRDRIAHQQIALAGYRLANLLNEIFIE